MTESPEFWRLQAARLRLILDRGNEAFAVAMNGRTPAEWFAEVRRRIKP